MHELCVAKREVPVVGKVERPDRNPLETVGFWVSASWETRAVYVPTRTTKCRRGVRANFPGNGRGGSCGEGVVIDLLSAARAKSSTSWQGRDVREWQTFAYAVRGQRTGRSATRYCSPRLDTTTLAGPRYEPDLRPAVAAVAVRLLQFRAEQWVNNGNGVVVRIALPRNVWHAKRFRPRWAKRDAERARRSVSFVFFFSAQESGGRIVPREKVRTPRNGTFTTISSVSVAPQTFSWILVKVSVPFLQNGFVPKPVFSGSVQCIVRTNASFRPSRLKYFQTNTLTPV